MRPRSIVAPVLLILAGVFFLTRNLLPEIPYLELFFRYWPFLLIAWGVVRFAEVNYWYFRGRTLPGSGMGGGEWALIVLLCLFGTAGFWAYNRPWPGMRISGRAIEMFGESFDFPVAATKTVGRAPRVVLELGRGNAKIIGGDTDTIQVGGRKSIRAYEQADAERADKETPIEIVTMGEQVLIRTNLDKLTNSRRGSAELEITLPKGASFEGRGKYGDFDVSDLAGSVEVVSDNAGVRVRNIGGSVRAELRRSDIIRAVNVKGGVEVKGRGEDLELDAIEGPVTINGSYSGELVFRNLAKPIRFEGTQTQFRVEKTAGTIRMRRGNLSIETVQGPVRVRSTTKDLQLRDFSGELDLELDNGDIELRPARQNMGKIDVRAKNGSIDLALAPGTRFELKARTERGEIQNDFGAPLKVDTHGREAEISGSTGAGPVVTLQTGRGDVTIRKAGIDAPRPPDPPAPVLPRTLSPGTAPPVPETVRQ